MPTFTATHVLFAYRGADVVVGVLAAQPAAAPSLIAAPPGPVRPGCVAGPQGVEAGAGRRRVEGEDAADQGGIVQVTGEDPAYELRERHPRERHVGLLVVAHVAVAVGHLDDVAGEVDPQRLVTAAG